MKRVCVAAAVAVPLLLAPSGARAQLIASPSAISSEVQSAASRPDARIGFVDLNRVASLSKEGRALIAKVDDIRARKGSEVEARGKDVAALQNQLEQSSSVLNDAARDQLRRQFERAQVDFQRFAQDAQTEVAQVQRELELAFMHKAYPAIESVARERSLWAVFNVAEQGLLWREPTLDISEEIARRIDTAP